MEFTHRLIAAVATVSLLLLCGQRPAVLNLLALAVIQTGVGAGVVLSGLNFAATAFHLAMALVMLLVTGSMWAGEAKGESP